jgi:hypothetical protein
MPRLSDKRRHEAREILRANDRGGYTIPTDGLYPFQWNWDATICAAGIATYDEARAFEEFHSLMRGLWRTEPQVGLLPQIIFHKAADTYFPGPEEWGTEGKRTPATSAISQPPVHATMLRMIVERAKDQSAAQPHVKKIVPDLLLHHRWWLEQRDPLGTGLVCCLHPWESGMDNSPAWDGAMAATPRATREFKRKDLSHIEPDMRPSHTDYERFVYLMDLQRACGFDLPTIFQRTPFCVNDIGIIFILMRANDDLAWLCESIGLKSDADYLLRKNQRTKSVLSQLWSDDLGQFVSRNVLTRENIPVQTSSGLLAGYAGVRDTTQQLEQWLAQGTHGIPSTHCASPQFEAKRYWRGPVWLHVNWMLAQNCADSTSQKIAQRCFTMVEQNGFNEYYEPRSGAGLGGRAFSWAASTMLFWEA